MKILILGLALLATHSVFAEFYLPEGVSSSKQRVIKHINDNASWIYSKTHNAADSIAERIVLADSISETQADILIDVLSNLREGSAMFAADEMTYIVVNSQNLTNSHREVAKAIFEGNRNGNDFQESIALTLLFGKSYISREKAQRLIYIFNNAKYNNGRNDTIEFMRVLNDKY